MVSHPRARGNTCRMRSSTACAIVHPRLAGNIVDMVVADEVLRFIPALAGTQRRWRAGTQGQTVHPRARVTGRCLSGLCGSSPRSRGTQLSTTISHIQPVHPALAGNTRGGRQCGRRWVHPRARGNAWDFNKLGALRFIPRAQNTRLEKSNDDNERNYARGNTSPMQRGKAGGAVHPPRARNTSH
jgi:hypothetical protein